MGLLSNLSPVSIASVTVLVSVVIIGSFTPFARSSIPSQIVNSKSSLSTFVDVESSSMTTVNEILEACEAETCVDISPFGSSLFALASQDTGNVLISPLGVSNALSLVLAGATPSSTCENEIKEVLKVSSHTELPRLGMLLSSTAEEGGVQLTTANSVWTNNIKPEYISLVREKHASEALALPKDYSAVDDWLKEKTHGLISNVLSGPIDSNVVALLMNVVHFKGSWANKFDESRTEDGTFNSSDGPLKARMMHAHRKMDVARLPGKATALRLDYGSNGSAGDFCAVFVLPHQPTTASMQEAINGIALKQMSKTLSLFSSKDVLLQLPRFKVEWGAKSLKPYLRKLGINSAFDGRGIFSGMSDDPKVYLDDVIQKVVMEVTEEGTVAASSTMAMMKSRSLPPPPLEISFDRPFLMIVMHSPTATPVFIGKFDKPELMF